MSETDFTDNGEKPEIKVLEPYRLHNISSSVAVGGVHDYDRADELSYNFTATHFGEPLGSGGEPLDSDGVSDFPNNRQRLETTVEELGGDSKEEIYEDKNWFSRPVPVEGTMGRWHTSLESSPVLESGKYLFDTALDLPRPGDDDEDYRESLGEVTFEKGLVLSGRVVDSSSRRSPVETSFRFFQDGTRVESFATGPSGSYNTSGVESKQYDAVEMEFFDERGRNPSVENWDGRLVAEKVSVRDGEGSVRFDYFRDPKVNIRGVKPVNMMAVQFGYDIGRASGTMKYNSGKVSVDEAQLFECNNWNYFGGTCEGDWERLDDDRYGLDPVSQTIQFDADPYKLSGDLSEEGEGEKEIIKNAYVVGTSSALRLDGSPVVGAEGGRAPVNSTTSVSGSLVTRNGASVQNADVEVEIGVGQQEFSSATDTTDSEGRFSTDIDVPSEPGNYSLSVSAERSPYKPLSRTFDRSLTAFIEKSMSLNLAESVDGQLELVQGQRTERSIKIENTGQAAVEDVSVSVSNLDNQFYNLSTNTIASIDTGQTATSDIEILIPEGFSLNQFPSFTISADGRSGNTRISSETKFFTIVEASGAGSQSPSQDRSTSETNSTATPEQADNKTSNGLLPESPSSAIGSFSEAASLSQLTPTGRFVDQTSNLNLALGLVFVLLLVVAAAVKKKNGGSNRRNRTSRVSTDRPSVTSVSESPLEGSSAKPDEPDASHNSQVQTVAEEDSIESPETVCEECGESFDTQAALDMHLDATH